MWTSADYTCTWRDPFWIGCFNIPVVVVYQQQFPQQPQFHGAAQLCTSIARLHARRASPSADADRSEGCPRILWSAVLGMYDLPDLVVWVILDTLVGCHMVRIV